MEPTAEILLVLFVAWALFQPPMKLSRGKWWRA